MVTPQKALDMSRKGYDWLRYVQERLNSRVPEEACKGVRSCSIEFECKNDVTLAECTEKVTTSLKRLGWGVEETEVHSNNKKSIIVTVKW